MKTREITLADIWDRMLRLEKRIDALERRPKAGRPPERSDLAVVWLGKYLKRGPIPISRIIADGIKDGFTAAILRRAGGELGIISDRRVWRLPS